MSLKMGHWNQLALAFFLCECHLYKCQVVCLCGGMKRIAWTEAHVGSVPREESLEIRIWNSIVSVPHYFHCRYKRLKEWQGHPGLSEPTAGCPDEVHYHSLSESAD